MSKLLSNILPWLVYTLKTNKKNKISQTLRLNLNCLWNRIRSSLILTMDLWQYHKWLTKCHCVCRRTVLELPCYQVFLRCYLSQFITNLVFVTVGVAILIIFPHSSWGTQLPPSWLPLIKSLCDTESSKWRPSSPGKPTSCFMLRLGGKWRSVWKNDWIIKISGSDSQWLQDKYWSLKHNFPSSLFPLKVERWAKNGHRCVHVCICVFTCGGVCVYNYMWRQ